MTVGGGQLASRRRNTAAMPPNRTIESTIITTRNTWLSRPRNAYTTQPAPSASAASGQMAPNV